MNFNKLHNLLTSDFSFCIEYDYNTINNCYDRGCHEEGICRCGTIEDFTINKIYLDTIVNVIYNEIFDIDSKEFKRIRKIEEVNGEPNIDYYIIDRVVRKNKLYDTNNFYERISSGYYGEELDLIRIGVEVSNKVYNDLITGLSFSTLTEKIEWLLEYEYGEVLEKHSNKIWKLVELSPEIVKISSKSHFDKISDEYIYDEYESIFCLCSKSGGDYKLIDGYHRLKSALNTKRKKIKVLYYE